MIQPEFLISYSDTFIPLFLTNESLLFLINQLRNYISRKCRVHWSIGNSLMFKKNKDGHL